MKYASILALLAPLCALGCTESPPKPATNPAEKVKPESELAFTNLSKKAYLSLEIKVQEAKVTEVNERLALTGWIMAKPGNEVTLTAPAAGYVRFTKNKVPIWDSVTKNDELLQLEPVLSPVEKIQVASLERTTKSDLVKAQTTLKNAQIELTRTEELLKVNGKNKQELEHAQKAVALAKEDEASATERLTFFQIQKQRIPVKAPQDGKILQLHVGEGQYVSVAAPLVSIIDLNPVWIRVPVPEYDYKSVSDYLASNPKADIEIKNDNGKTPFLQARSTGRVAQIDPIKHTADFWYELLPTKEANAFVKDQMVTVLVPISTTKEAKVIPYSAIVFDAHGHAWIYLERTTDKDAKHRFERRPVELVSAAQKDDVVIRANLASGDRIVISGAAALFSRDFHKTPTPGEDD